MTVLLRKKKLQILERNFQADFGEIDILARDGQTLVFVVVKTKTSDRFDSVVEMVTVATRQKLILLAHELQMKHQTEAVRIDIITVDNAQEEPVIKHHPRIIEYHGR